MCVAGDFKHDGRHGIKGQHGLLEACRADLRRQKERKWLTELHRHATQDNEGRWQHVGSYSRRFDCLHDNRHQHTLIGMSRPCAFKTRQYTMCALEAAQACAAA